MKEYGLVGYPLRHSFSKKYFTKKFQKERISAVFHTYSINTINLLYTVTPPNHKLSGLSVTHPFKESIIRFLNSVDPLVAEIRACNCVKFMGDKSIGYNTDVIGFEKSLIRKLKPHHNRALILGTGGAARAVEWVFKKLGIPSQMVSRTKEEGRLIYSELDEAIIREHKLIVNCTPVGNFPDVELCPDIPYQYLDNTHFLYDLIYNPEKPLFLQKGEEKGALIENGYQMLIIQAEASWRIWNGKKAEE